MAIHLNKIKKRLNIASGVFVAFIAGAANTAAQSLPDPTRPPMTDASQQQGKVSPVVGPELQSVLVSPNRKVAIISGQSVQLGEKYGDARVVKITESEVVLRNGQEVQVLKLFPEVQKKASHGRAGNAENR